MNTKTKQGLLLKLEALKKDLNVQEFEKNQINILHTVEEKGLHVEVKIIGEVYLEKYVQILGFNVINTKNTLGQKRMENLLNHLNELLFNEKYLLENHEVEGGYLYGEHNLSERSSGPHKASYLRKINSNDLELLLIDQMPRVNGPREIYYYDGELCVRGQDVYDIGKEKRLNENLEDGLSQLYGYSAIDENGHYYNFVEINDQENIRLLTNEYNHTLSGRQIKSKEVLRKDYSGYYPGSTLKEILCNLIANGEPIPEELQKNSLPIQYNNFTIYSNRVIGKDIPTFKENNWIQTTSKSQYHYDPEVGRYGRVMKQDGTILTVQWEGNYVTDKDHIDYGYVKLVNNPFVKLESPVLVSIANKIGYDGIRCFGWLVERTDNVSKVIPIGNAEHILKFNLGYTYYKDRENYEEFLAEFEKESGETFNFLLVSNSEIDQEVIPSPLKEFLLNENRVKGTKYIGLKNLVELSKAKEQNVEYFADQLEFLTTKIPFEEIVKDFTHQIVFSTERVSYKKRVEFGETDILKWIQSKI